MVKRREGKKGGGTFNLFGNKKKRGGFLMTAKQSFKRKGKKGNGGEEAWLHSVVEEG